MNHSMIRQCPACGGQLVATRLGCSTCEIAIEGRFDTSAFGRLSQEQQGFVKTFLAARGNIKLVERELGISYPTVRNRIQAVQQALGLSDRAAGEEDEKAPAAGVLDKLAAGDISVDEALKELE